MRFVVAFFTMLASLLGTDAASAEATPAATGGAMAAQASCTFGAPVHERRWKAVDAVGGVYWRNSPHWNDTDRIPGCGFYQGDYIHLICYDWGDAVGPHGNTLWYYAQDENNNSVGFINDHYLNTPGTAQNPTLNAPDCWGP